jgi:dolichyl-phosphate-mannose-protein mannosyltransferase
MSKSQTTRSTRRRTTAAFSIPAYWYYGLLLLVLLFFAAIRFRLRDMPLERDEGEYAYAGQLMLQGIPPYKLAYTMKLPGTFAAYAVILAVFGQTPAGIHLGLILVNAATTILVYFLVVRLSGRLAGLVAAASYALLSTSTSVLGFAGHATNFVVFAALAGILLLLRALESNRSWLFFASGLVFGLAYLMKQSGIAFAAFGLLFLIKRQAKRPVDWRSLAARVGGFGLGLILPIGFTCLLLAASGAYKTFWFWTVDYARQYAAEVGPSLGFQIFTQQFPRIVGPVLWIWIIAAVGVTTFLWHRDNRLRAFFVGTLLLFSFLAVCPGFFFREHYFIQMLPVVALLAGIAVNSATQRLTRAGHGLPLTAIPALLFLAAFAYSIHQQKTFLFKLDPLTACRTVYQTNPFPEALQVANYIAAHSPKDARIAVLGSEPEIYFYAKRHAVTGYIYTYGLMEEQPYALQMQKQMIDEIELGRPEFLVRVLVPVSWLARPTSPGVNDFFSWANSYLDTQYELAGVADMLGPDYTEYHWGDEAKAYRPRSPYVVQVFKRKA